MATNGESARKWLLDNCKTITTEQVNRVRESLIKKIDQTPEPENNDLPDPHQGLLEALDVLDAWLLENTAASPKNLDETIPLDYRPLVTEPSEPINILTEKEKLREFHKLLESM